MILYYLKTFIRSSSGWNSFSPGLLTALQTAFPQSDANVQANSMPDALIINQRIIMLQGSTEATSSSMTQTAS